MNEPPYLLPLGEARDGSFRYRVRPMPKPSSIEAAILFRAWCPYLDRYSVEPGCSKIRCHRPGTTGVLNNQHCLACAARMLRPLPATVTGTGTATSPPRP